MILIVSAIDLRAQTLFHTAQIDKQLVVNSKAFPTKSN